MKYFLLVLTFILISLIALVPLQSPGEIELSLDEFLAEIPNRNLSLKAESASAQAAQEGALGITIPPPMINLIQMRDESGRVLNFEISQTLPPPTKLSNDHSARRYEAEGKKSKLSTREHEIQADGKLLYFRLWKTQENIRLLNEKKALLDQHLKLTRATTRSDSFLKIHLIKVETDLDLLQNELLQAEEEKREKQIEVAEFLDQNPKEFKPIAKGGFPISRIPKEEELSHPLQLRTKQLDLEVLKSREKEAKTTWFPEFNLRYRELGGTPMTSKSSELMIGLSLPFVFFWEPQAANGRARAERMQGEFLLLEEKRKIESRQTILLTKAESLQKQLNQFQEKLLPRAEKRVRVVYSLAPRDMETLQDHRETLENLPDLKIKILTLQEQYEEAIAELEKYLSDTPATKTSTRK